MMISRVEQFFLLLGERPKSLVAEGFVPSIPLSELLFLGFSHGLVLWKTEFFAKVLSVVSSHLVLFRILTVRELSKTERVLSLSRQVCLRLSNLF